MVLGFTKNAAWPGPPSDGGNGPELSQRQFLLWLGAIIASGLAWRLVYTLSQASVDPWFAQPMIDGRYYADWASSLMRGEAGPADAFYLAPLYPYFLAGVFRVFGQSFGALYVLQHLLAAATAFLIAWAGRSRVGAAGALCGAALFMLHHALWFFAARPLGETLAIFLLVAALAMLWREGWRACLAAGALIGLAALARPNLLLVAAVWAAGEATGRAWRRMALLVAGLAVVVLPVTARNWLESGHLVPISSNGGITAYHGNGPGALGVYTHPFGFSFDVTRQREEATRLARARTGRDLDAVEADAWWGSQALATRLERPLDSLGLVAWRAALTLGNRELGLDYPPQLDPNPLRATIRLPGGHEESLVPWAVLIGLAAAGVAAYGFRGTGGGTLWWAIAACAATPILFYVSSRYRLPTAALLALPAGAGAAGLIFPDARPARSRWVAVGVGLMVAVVSFAVPSGDLNRLLTAEGLGNRAQAYLLAGRVDAAEADARRAVELQPESVRLWVNLGAALLAGAKLAEAEASYRRALDLDPASCEATGGLASTLAAEGRLSEGIGSLRRALSFEPRNLACWNALVGLLYAGGDTPGAMEEVRRAQAMGLRLEPSLVEAIKAEAGGPDKEGIDP
jgi:tetratricopeptide (TPR) repeat protein